MTRSVNDGGIRSVLWFLPTTGDSRYVGSDVGARSPTFDYLGMVARAADTLGYDGLLVPSGRWCDDPWIASTAIAPTTRRVDFLLALRPGLISPVIAARSSSVSRKTMEASSALRLDSCAASGG